MCVLEWCFHGNVTGMFYWFGMVLPSCSFCAAGSDGSNVGVLIETMSVNVHQSASDAPIGLITFRSGLCLTNLLAINAFEHTPEATENLFTSYRYSYSINFDIKCTPSRASINSSNANDSCKLTILHYIWPNITTNGKLVAVICMGI